MKARERGQRSPSYLLSTSSTFNPARSRRAQWCWRESAEYLGYRTTWSLSVNSATDLWVAYSEFLFLRYLGCSSVLYLYLESAYRNKQVYLGGKRCSRNAGVYGEFCRCVWVWTWRVMSVWRKKLWRHRKHHIMGDREWMDGGRKDRHGRRRRRAELGKGVEERGKSQLKRPKYLFCFCRYLYLYSGRLKV